MFFEELLESSKKILLDCEGNNLFEDYYEFRGLNKDQVLDQPQNL